MQSARAWPTSCRTITSGRGHGARRAATRPEREGGPAGAARPGFHRPAGTGTPRDQREEALCSILADLLDLERVGTEDNFFDLGGDSLLSLRVVTRARQAGIIITQLDVFRCKTVAPAAAQLSASRSTARHDTELAKPLVPLSSQAIGRLKADSPALADILPLAPFQRGLLFHALTNPGSYIEPVVCELTVPAPAGRAARRGPGAAAEIPAPCRGLRVPRTRTSRYSSSPPSRIRPGERWTSPGSNPASRELELARIVAGEQRHGFDVSRHPLLLRATLVRLADERHYLDPHHASPPDRRMVADAAASGARRPVRRLGTPAGKRAGVPSYRDYLSWVDGQDHGSALAAWRANPKRARAPYPDSGRRPGRLLARTCAHQPGTQRRAHSPPTRAGEGAWPDPQDSGPGLMGDRARPSDRQLRCHLRQHGRNQAARAARCGESPSDC